MRLVLFAIIILAMAGCNTTQPVGGVATGATIGFLVWNIPGAAVGAAAGATVVETHDAYYNQPVKCRELRGCVFQ